ncbi:MAG: class II fructose-bisphosphatase [Clostridia bacterium]|nr:MAG: class II fructose-bisphosphatase [Clostridia bacterium]
MTPLLRRNLGLDLVRVTESTAIHAGRWMGLGKRIEADHTAIETMHHCLSAIEMNGRIVIGEESKSGLHSPLDTGNFVGNGKGPEMDVVLDPIDGTDLLVNGRSGAISVIAAAPRGSMWSPYPAAYLEKLVVDREVAHALVPEALDAPAPWTLAMIARIKKKTVKDLVVFVLDRPRHQDLIEEIRMSGARVALRRDGDVAGAILAAIPGSGIDVMMGVGGAAEGVLAACAVKSLRGAMALRLAPQSEEERQRVQDAGLDISHIMCQEEVVQSEQIFFAATGVTDGMLLDGVQYGGGFAKTHSLVLRAKTGTRRMIRAERLLDELIAEEAEIKT